MRCAIAHPCSGSSDSTRRISRSSVPCTRSVGLLTVGSYQLLTGESIHQSADPCFLPAKARHYGMPVRLRRVLGVGLASALTISGLFAAGPATFARDVAPLLLEHCDPRRPPNGSAPFPLP